MLIRGLSSSPVRGMDRVCVAPSTAGWVVVVVGGAAVVTVVAGTVVAVVVVEVSFDAGRMKVRAGSSGRCWTMSNSTKSTRYVLYGDVLYGDVLYGDEPTGAARERGRTAPAEAQRSRPRRRRSVSCSTPASSGQPRRVVRTASTLAPLLEGLHGPA